MRNQPKEIIFLYFGTILFWMLLAYLIWALGQRWERIRPLRQRMRGHWRQALIITIIYLVSVFFSGRGINPYGVAIFCQALIGLAIASGIPAFESLPVIDSVLRRDRVKNSLFLFIVVSLAAGVLGVMFGGLAMGITQNAFHEVSRTNEVMQAFPADKFQMFFLFLAGGGIAEEMVHRLVLLSLVWALTKRPWFAILVSAVIHSAYHFTPLDPLYLTFLKFPISQFVSGVVMGTLWGYVFVKRGYETVALAHTLSDWLPMLFLM
jgi:hypothetical protein